MEFVSFSANYDYLPSLFCIVFSYTSSIRVLKNLATLKETPLIFYVCFKWLNYYQWLRLTTLNRVIQACSCAMNLLIFLSRLLKCKFFIIETIFALVFKQWNQNIYDDSLNLIKFIYIWTYLIKNCEISFEATFTTRQQSINSKLSFSHFFFSTNPIEKSFVVLQHSSRMLNFHYFFL